jgi:hypothetical protein
VAIPDENNSCSLDQTGFDTIVTGSSKPNYRAMKLEFSSYVQQYNATSNDTKSRARGAIALYPTGNSTGDFYFMSLATGQRIRRRRSWTILPMSDLVVSRVEAMDQTMPMADHSSMISEYDPDELVDESANDKDYKAAGKAAGKAGGKLGS